MSRDLTWLEAAEACLNYNDNQWMSAPDLVRDISERGVRVLRSEYGQAVRTLRSTLNAQSRKETGAFLRTEINYNVCFCLKNKNPKERSVGNGSKPSAKPSPQTVPSKRLLGKDKEKAKSVPAAAPVMTNGLPPTSPPPTHHPTPTNTPNLPLTPLTIEIDPSTKNCRPNKKNSDSNGGGFCLPSPLTSILGPKRTLHVLSESVIPPSMRPMRQVRRKKSVKDQENDAVISTPVNGHLLDGNQCFGSSVGQSTALTEILHFEMCHRVPSHLSDIACLRFNTSYSTPDSSAHKKPDSYEDPCSVQGERIRTESLEIHPKYFEEGNSETDSYSDSESSLSSASETFSDSETELSDTIPLQPRPTSQLLVRRHSQSQQRYQLDYSYAALDADGQAGGDHSPMETSSNIKMVQKERTRKYSEPSVKFKLPNRVQRSDQQHKPVSSLFQPTSPLVNENLKSLLNPESFKGLSESQRKKLIQMLPLVDRGNINSIADGSLNNSFYGSALREWLERVAMGTFTAEYRAKVRGEEKRRCSTFKTEDQWKQKYYEQYWGERNSVSASEDDTSAPTPYYPHNTQPSHHSLTCLNSITNAYNTKKTEARISPPSPPPPISSPPPVTTPSTTSANTTTHLERDEQGPATQPTCTTTPPRTVAVAKKQKPNVVKNKVANTAKPKASTVTNQQKNHVSKKLLANLKQNDRTLLPCLLSSNSNKLTGSRVSKCTSNNSKRSQLKRLVSSVHLKSLKTSLKSQTNKPGKIPGHLLTHLPSKTPYQTLLMALTQASKTSKVELSSLGLNSAPPPPPQTTQPPPQANRIPHIEHSHSVYKDHFALLNNNYIPTEFSLPITTLPVHFPLQVYKSCLQSRRMRAEHSYARTYGADGLDDALPVDVPSLDRGKSNAYSQSLKLSVPRSLIRTDDNDSCLCDREPLVFCSGCHSLYHSTCTQSTLCPSCLACLYINS